MVEKEKTVKCQKCWGYRWLRDDKIPGIAGIVKCHVCKGEGEVPVSGIQSKLPFDGTAATKKK